MSEQTPANATNTPAIKPVTRFTLVVVGGLLYYGLAILGWGGWTNYFSHPPLVALAWVMVVLLVASYFAGGNVSPGVRRGSRESLGAHRLWGARPHRWLAAGLHRSVHDFWTLDGDATRWVGIVLFAIGGALRVWPVYVLGNRFSGLVAIQPGHRLVTTGVYRFIRHPSYLGLLVNSLGWGLAFRAGAGVLLTALLLVPLLARIRAEERLLRSQFGDEYAAFCARTWRLIPGIY